MSAISQYWESHLNDNAPTTTTFVPWQEGAELLGLKRSAFFYLVETGQIRIESGRGPRDGRYSLEDIEAIKRKRASGKPRKAIKPRKRLAPVIYDWLSPLDIPAILRLDQQVYNEMLLAEAIVYQQWSEKNPQLAMAAFDARSNRQEMLGYVAALPLDEAVILSILRNERKEISITKDEIQTYDRPGAYTLLANSAVIHPNRPDLLFPILTNIAQEWIRRYPERYVTRIYAQSESARGDQLVQHFFMAPRYDLAPNAYMLDLSRPGTAKLIRWYQYMLSRKAPLPPELRQSYTPESWPAIELPTSWIPQERKR